VKFRLPTPEEFAAFLDPTGNASDNPELRVATLRDLARIAELAHLIEEGFLGTRAVLTGGMAMKLRGSSRLTMLDADLSATRGQDISEDDVLDVLEVDSEEITIVPERVKTGSDLLTVFPVSFVMRPPPAPLARGDRHFKVDLSSRGLELEPDRVPFRHDYPFETGLEGEPIPLMALVESVAEKTIGYGMFRLAKHYADLAFVADVSHAQLVADANVLRDIARKKLEDYVTRFPRLAKDGGISDFGSLEPAFTVDRHLRIVKVQWEQEVRYLGGAAQQYTFIQARDLVTNRLVPLLFPR
jgi:hypothetical protein